MISRVYDMQPLRHWVSALAMSFSVAVSTASAAPPAAMALPPAAAEIIYAHKSEGDYVVPNFHFASGEMLPELRVHFTTLGKIHRDTHGRVDNAILIMHGTGGSGRSFLQERFAGVLFGKGQLLDVNRYYIVLPDAIGHGGSSKPSDGLHAHFPNYNYQDMIGAQYALVTLGLSVDHLRLVMGTSMGCMQTYLWAETYADFMDAALPLACLPAPIAGRNRLWRQLIIEAIRTDPQWLGGEYRSEPQNALRTAAGLLLLAGSAPLSMQQSLPSAAAADEFLNTYMSRQLNDIDANDLLYQISASRDYDPSKMLEKIKVPLTHVNSADDFVNPPELGIVERDIKRVPHGRFVLLAASEATHGHGTHTWAAVWQPYLSQLLDASQPH